MENREQDGASIRKKTNRRSDKLVEVLFQNKSINQDLQNLWLMLLYVENNIKKTWLQKIVEKRFIDDKDDWICFVKIIDFMEQYDVADLENTTTYYRNLKVNGNWNNIKQEQIAFLHSAFDYLSSQIKALKEKIHNKSFALIREDHAHISKDQKNDMVIFLSEFPSIVNSLHDLIRKIYILGSDETKRKLEEYEAKKEYL